MKKLITVVLGSVLVLFVPALAIAQLDELKNSTPEQRAEMLTKKMETELQLDEETSTAVSGINLKYARENQALLDSSEPRLGKLVTFRQNAQAKDAELKAVLNPTQYSLYEQKKDEMEATMKQKLREKYEASE